LKKVLIFFLIAVAIAMILPSFADQVSKTLKDKDSSDASTGFNPRNFHDFNNTFNATSNEKSTVYASNGLTSAQIQKLKDTQNKLVALIDKIRGLKTKYANIKSKGILNALDQFEKQANQLNNEISAFIQNPTVSDGSVEGKINSFVKREAALEHKVMIKEELLIKMSTKQVKNNSQVENSSNDKNVINQKMTKNNKKNKENKKNKKTNK